ncbi:MAG: DUF1109 family protein [Leptospirales bacterium]|nr:DUF1109 family protein [Leptospirales bacterium]
MTTDELIHNLTRSIKPVNRIASTPVRLIVWFVCAVTATAMLIALVRLAAPQMLIIVEPAFYLESLSALLACFLAAAAALYLSIPGERLLLLPILLAAAVTVWLASIAYRWGIHHAFLYMPAMAEMRCGRDIMIGGLGSAGILVGMIKRAAPVSPIRCAMLAALASSLLAVVALQFFCAMQSPWHLLTCHVAPAFVVTITGVIAGRWVLAW